MDRVLQTIPDENQQILELTSRTNKLWSKMQYVNNPYDVGGLFGLIDTYKHVNKTKPGAKHITKKELFAILPNAALEPGSSEISERSNKKGFYRVRYVVKCGVERYILSGRWFPRCNSRELPENWFG